MMVLFPAMLGAAALSAICLIAARFRVDDVFIRFGLVLGALANLLIVAGTIGMLRPIIIIVFFLICSFFLFKEGKGLCDWVRGLAFANQGVMDRFFGFSLLAALTLTFAICFLPEIANDALSIQLYLAKLFAVKGLIFPQWMDLASYRPLLMSVLYAAGLALNSVAIAKLTHWFCGLLLLGAFFKTASVSINRTPALFLTLILWLTPTLLNQITTTYIDAGVALFVFLGYVLTVRALEEERMEKFFYAGLCFGVAAAIRYLALGAIFAAGMTVLIALPRSKTKIRLLGGGICLGLGMLLVCSYWFIRGWMFAGNPVYPYFGKIFGTEDYALFSSIYLKMGLPRSIGTFLSLPFDLTFRPHHFDYHHWIGPAYLVLLPAFLFAAFRVKRAAVPAQFVFFALLFWYFTGQNVRYLLPVFPIYLLAAGFGISAWPAGRLLRSLSVITGCGLVLFGMALGTYHFRRELRPLLRLESAQTYLEKSERTIPVANWINQNLPQASKILVLEEPRLFYFDREVVLDFDFNVRMHYQDAESGKEMAEILKGEGITHILDMVWPGAGQEKRPIEKILRNTALSRLVATVESQNIRETRFEYQVYALN